MRCAIIVFGALSACLTATGCGGDSGSGSGPRTHRGVALTYQAVPVTRAQINPVVMQRAANVMRERLAALGIEQVTVNVAGDTVRVTLPAVKRSIATRALAVPARLGFYDWEPNVIGPDGYPAPSDANVTGGSSAGAPGAGSVSHYAAVLRAAERPPVAGADTTPARGQLYLVDPAAKRVVAGPADTRAVLLGALPGGHRPSGSRVVKVSAGTIVVQAEQPGGRHVDQWYVLRDRPALTGTDITNPAAEVDHGPGGTGQPIVTFDFTPRGKELWRDITRTIARRGQAMQIPGTPMQSAAQHFALVLDDELVSVPFIDFQHNPDGIDASNGSQIEGGFTPASARRLAALLKSGMLPVDVRQVSAKPVRLP